MIFLILFIIFQAFCFGNNDKNFHLDSFYNLFYKIKTLEFLIENKNKEFDNFFKKSFPNISDDYRESFKKKYQSKNLENLTFIRKIMSPSIRDHNEENKKEFYQKIIYIFKKNFRGKIYSFLKKGFISYSSLDHLFLKEEEYEKINPLEFLVRSYKKNFKFEDIDEDCKYINGGDTGIIYRLLHHFSLKNSELQQYYGSRGTTGGIVREFYLEGIDLKKQLPVNIFYNLKEDNFLIYEDKNGQVLDLKKRTLKGISHKNDLIKEEFEFRIKTFLEIFSEINFKLAEEAKIKSLVEEKIELNKKYIRYYGSQADTNQKRFEECLKGIFYFNIRFLLLGVPENEKNLNLLMSFLRKNYQSFKDKTDDEIFSIFSGLNYLKNFYFSTSVNNETFGEKESLESFLKNELKLRKDYIFTKSLYQNIYPFFNGIKETGERKEEFNKSRKVNSYSEKKTFWEKNPTEIKLFKNAKSFIEKDKKKGLISENTEKTLIDFMEKICFVLSQKIIFLEKHGNEFYYKNNKEQIINNIENYSDYKSIFGF